MVLELGVLEVSGWHRNCLLDFSRSVDTDKYNLNLFTSEDVYSDMSYYLDGISYSVFLKKDRESIEVYLDEVEGICSDFIDILFVVTPFGDSSLASNLVDFSPNCHMVCFLHQINAWLKTKNRRSKQIFKKLNNISGRSKLIDGFLYRAITPFRFFLYPYIISNYDSIITPYPPMENHIKKQTNIKSNIYSFIPVIGKKHNILDIDRDTVRITIAGRINQDIRNYKDTLEIFKNIFPRYNDSLSLQILGRPIGRSGKNIINRYRKLKQTGYNIDLYVSDSWISIKEFDRELKKSHILLNPIKVYENISRSFAPNEIRGRTKTTGILHESIKYGIPLLLPKKFKSHPTIQKSIIMYRSKNQLKNKIINLVKNKTSLKRQTRNAKTTSDYFTIEKQQNRLKSIIKNITKTKKCENL